MKKTAITEVGKLLVVYAFRYNRLAFESQFWAAKEFGKV